MENTKTKIRPQDVSRVMRNAGLPMSKELRQRICYISTYGWRVRSDYWGEVKIEWNSGHWRAENNKEEQTQKLAELLTKKGYMFTFHLDRFTITGRAW